MVDEPSPLEQSAVIKRLSAVQLLLSSDRSAAEHDILIATIVEALKTRPEGVDGLAEFANTVWPGSLITTIQIRTALMAATAASLVKLLSGDDGCEKWGLTTLAVEEMQRARDWSIDVVTRFENFLMDRAVQEFGHCDEITAHLWATILEDALFTGIRSGLSSEKSGLFVTRASTISSNGFHLDLIFKVIDEDCADASVNSFLRALALDALDPSNPFGNEIVHNIATGFALNAFLARRDHLSERQQIGTLRGQVVILDTPILLRLLGSDDQASLIWQTLRVSSDQGVSVLVFEWTFEELKNLLSRLTPEALIAEEDIAAGVSPGMLAKLLDQPLRLWLEKREREEIGSWDDFALQVDKLPTKIVELGGSVVVKRSAYSLAESGLFYKFETALEDVLTERNATRNRPTRGKPQITHDARLMLEVQSRRPFPEPDTTFWPGATILSVDTAIAPAYRRALNLNAETFPSAVTFSQWMAIVTSCAEPADAELVARFVPTELAYETLLSIAVRFPIESSRAIVEVLSNGNSGSATNVRIAQMTIDDLLNNQHEIIDDPVSFGNQVASIVIGIQGRRIAEAAKWQRDNAATERDREKQQRVVEQALSQRDSEARVEAEALSIAFEARAEKAETSSAKSVLQLRRMPIIYVLMTIGIVLAICAAVLNLWWLFSGTLLSVGILWRNGNEWSRDPEKHWGHLLTSLIPELLVVIQFIHHN
jgi:hypothetical protein